jgi:1-acyl-sn-glycerol-3-phosphate acyltransferase
MTVGKLRKLIKSGRVSRSSVGFPAWPRSEAVQQLREGLRQAVLFPIVDHWVTGIRVEGKQNLAKINNPSILISNHVGNFDLTLIMRVLPPKIRRRLFAVADAEHYKQNWRAGLLYLLGNAYSMVKDGSRAKQELEFITDLIDQSWTLLITPEGEYGQTEGEMEAFRRGTALIAVETQTPVVPFKIENFDRIYKSVKTFPYQPDGKGEITLKIGPPKIYPRSASYQEVSEDMRAQIESL